MNGKEINLTSDNINIKSDNFSVDSNGNMTCKSATINNGNTTITSEGLIKQISEESGLALFYMENNGYKSYVSPEYIYFFNKNDDSSYISMGFVQDTKGVTAIDNTGIYTPKVRIRGGGTVMYGQDTGNTYQCNWTGSQLQFFVDSTYVGTLSDARLKNEIKNIDEDFIKAIEEIQIKQFKIVNRNGLVSFGILAQDLIGIFKKYNKNPFEYEIVQQTQYKIDDNTNYYTIDYVQFLVLKQLAADYKIKNLSKIVNQLQNKVKELEDKING